MGSKGLLVVGGLLLAGALLYIPACTRDLATPGTAPSANPTATNTAVPFTPTFTFSPTSTPTTASTPNFNATFFPTCTQTSTPDAIDDMEDNNNMLLTNQCRNGSWYAFADTYTSATLSGPVTLPTPQAVTVVGGETAASNPITLQAGGTVLNSGTIASGTVIVWGQTTLFFGPGGATQYLPSNSSTPMPMDNTGYNSSYCAYIKGVVGPGCTGNDISGAYSECPYAGMGFSFLNPKAAYSISMFNGVQFYAMIDPGTSTSFRCNIPTTDTNSCNDHYGASFTPTSSWALYQIPTGAGNTLTQAYASGSCTGPFNAANATDVQWQTTAGGATYGLYVDNISFY